MGFKKEQKEMGFSRKANRPAAVLMVIIVAWKIPNSCSLFVDRDFDREKEKYCTVFFPPKIVPQTENKNRENDTLSRKKI